MRSSRQGALPSELGWLLDELDGFARRINTLEAPSGEALNATVKRLTDLVNNIQAQLDAYNAGRYTNTQIDSKVANPGNISPGTVNAAGDVGVGGALIVTGAATVGGRLKAADAYTYITAAGRRQLWIGPDGSIGVSS